MPDCRFTRQQRLLKASDFQFVFKKPIRSRDAFFTVLGRTTRNDYARLGLAVSRKTDKRSVMRNRLKRLIRESFRQTRLAALDIVVISQPPAAKASTADLRSSLTRHWQRLARGGQGAGRKNSEATSRG